MCTSFMRWLALIPFLLLEVGCTASAGSSLGGSTLIVDEMPGRLTGSDEGPPPGRVVHVAADGSIVFEMLTLKMPYDAVRAPDGTYFVNLIRARAVPRVAADGPVAE